MSVANPYLTFKNIQDAVIADSKLGEASREQVKRFINQGYADLITRRKREFLDDDFNYALDGKQTGDCSVTNGSTTVNWTDTSTTLAFATGAEYKLWIGGTNEVYDIVSNTSSTITLDLAYVGSTNTSAVATIVQSSILLSDTIKTVYQATHDYNTYQPQMVGPQRLQEVKKLEGEQQEGKARLVTVDEKNSNLQSRLYVWPYPDADYIIKLKCSKYFTQLTNDSDEPLIPTEYRQILYWYALAQAYGIQRNANWYASALQNYNTWLARLDTEIKPNQDEPSLVWNYTNRFVRPFARFYNGPRDEE